MVEGSPFKVLRIEGTSLSAITLVQTTTALGCAEVLPLNTRFKYDEYLGPSRMHASF
jgi:hypothetical protein